MATIVNPITNFTILDSIYFLKHLILMLILKCLKIKQSGIDNKLQEIIDLDKNKLW